MLNYQCTKLFFLSSKTVTTASNLSHICTKKTAQLNNLENTKPGYLTLRSDVRASSYMEIMKDSKLLSFDSATKFPCIAIVPIICSFAAYEKIFNEDWSLPFQEGRVVVIGKDVEYVNFLPSTSPWKYDHNIRTNRLWMYKEASSRLLKIWTKKPRTGKVRLA